MHINYLAQEAFASQLPSVDNGHGVRRCSYCGLTVDRAKQSKGFFRIPESDGSVCFLCMQALFLPSQCHDDGLIYLVPELSQASVIRLTAMAYAFSIPKPKQTNPKSVAATQSRIACARAARKFLSRLNQVGIDRWRKFEKPGWESAYVGELRSKLVHLPDRLEQEKALRGVNLVMRYVPIMSTRNRGFITELARSLNSRSVCMQTWQGAFESHIRTHTNSSSNGAIDR